MHYNFVLRKFLYTGSAAFSAPTAFVVVVVVVFLFILCKHVARAVAALM